MARRVLAAALMMLAATLAGAAEEATLGTLFLSAEERARLDSLRRGDPGAGPGSPAATARDHALTGYVQRSDGRSTVWIDGRPVRVQGRKAPALEPSAVQDYRGEGQDVHIERP